MKEFKVGQTVKISNKGVAEGWSLTRLIGTVFTVEKLDEDDKNGNRCAIHGPWFIPPEACELVGDVEAMEVYVIKHKQTGLYYYSSNEILTFQSKEGAERCARDEQLYATEIKRWKISEEDV